MKKLFFPITALVVLLPAITKAQNTELVNERPVKYENHFYFSPVEVFFHNFQIGIEHEFYSGNSLLIDGGLLLATTANVTDKGGDAEIQYRIPLYKYAKKESSLINEVFFAPYGRINSETESQSYPNSGRPDVSSSLFNYGGGLLMGFKVFSYSNRFCMSIYGGGGVKVSSVSGDYNFFRSSIITDDAYTGIIPRFGFQIGVSF